MNLLNHNFVLQQQGKNRQKYVDTWWSFLVKNVFQRLLMKYRLQKCSSGDLLINSLWIQNEICKFISLVIWIQHSFYHLSSTHCQLNLFCLVISFKWIYTCISTELRTHQQTFNHEYEHRTIMDRKTEPIFVKCHERFWVGKPFMVACKPCSRPCFASVARLGAETWLLLHTHLELLMMLRPSLA